MCQLQRGRRQEDEKEGDRLRFGVTLQYSLCLATLKAGVGVGKIILVRFRTIPIYLQKDSTTLFPFDELKLRHCLFS